VANPGVTTLTTIRTAIRQQADMTASQFVTDAEMNGYINSSYQELYGLVTQKFGNDYFSAGTPDNWYQFLTDGVSASYPIPDGSASYLLKDGVTTAPAFFKLLGVDLQVAPTSGQDGWLTIKPFPLVERNRFSFPNVQAAYGRRTSLRYRINGNRIWITPIPSGGQNIRLWYVPRCPVLIETVTITLVNVVVNNQFQYIYQQASGFAQTSNTLIATASTQNGANFIVGANDTATAANIVSSIQSTGTGPGALATVVSAVSSGPVVTLTLTQPMTLSLITGATTGSMTLGPGQQYFANGNQTLSVTNILDGVNGWEEYIIIDSAIKAKDKEESDTSVLMSRKAEIVRRMESEAENRDAGSPSTVGDSRRYNGSYGGDGGGEMLG